MTSMGLLYVTMYMPYVSMQTSVEVQMLANDEGCLGCYGTKFDI